MCRCPDVRAARFPAVLTVLVLFFMATETHARDMAVADEPSGRFARVESERIHAETRDILSQERFTPRKTLWQWLAEKLSRWEGLDLEASSGWTRVLYWVVVIWMLLALVFILGHLIWTLTTMFGGRRAGKSLAADDLAVHRQTLSLEELREQMRRFAEKGLLREALGVMMSVLLRWLDAARLVRYHNSKTNGDYLTEYPSAHPGRDDFQEFSLRFDRLIYGGGPVASVSYDRMNALFEQVQMHARNR